MSIRLLALDLDGTILDPYGKLLPAMRDAVARVARRGVEVILCTGRRYRTALPPARELGLSGPIVVHNGVVVKDLVSGKTLQHDYLPAAVTADVVTHVRTQGAPLVYVDAYHEGTDILTERMHRAHPFQQEYLADNTGFHRVVEDLVAELPGEVIMVSTMADAESLEALRAAARERLGERVRTHALMNKNYRGHILEFLHPTTSKWAALERLAAAEGIAPDEIAAVGDDSNDAEMIRHAGLGIAMGNAVPEARSGADLVVRSNAEGGAVEALEYVLSRL